MLVRSVIYGLGFDFMRPFQQKTHFCLLTRVRFLNEARLWRMKNEAGHRPMKCALRHMRMHGCDSLHIASGNASLTNGDKSENKTIRRE